MRHHLDLVKHRRSSPRVPVIFGSPASEGERLDQASSALATPTDHGTHADHHGDHHGGGHMGHRGHGRHGDHAAQ
jgi:hypothetical protein